MADKTDAITARLTEARKILANLELDVALVKAQIAELERMEKEG
jgi:hypothetical protein